MNELKSKEVSGATPIEDNQQSKIGEKIPKNPSFTEASKVKQVEEFGVIQFVKIVAFSFLTIFSAFFLGLRLRFLIETPFFFLAFKGDNVILLAIALILFLVTLCINILITSRSFVEFVPGWLLCSVALFIGIGNYDTPGVVIGSGFLIAIAIFYMFVQSDIENSFTFSVRHAFSSLTFFLVMFFAVISAGYYFSCTDKLESAGRMLPDEVVTPIYQFERHLVADQLGVDESKIEAELARLKEKGIEAKLGGILGFLDISGVQEGVNNLYQLTKEQLSHLIMPYLRWVSVGLALSLFLSLTPFSTVYSVLLKPILWGIIELLLAVGILKRVKEMREVEVLRI